MPTKTREKKASAGKANALQKPLHPSRSRFIAYIPSGSVDQGRQLATTGGNEKSAPCTIWALSR
jgi:hypothetical protein